MLTHVFSVLYMVLQFALLLVFAAALTNHTQQYGFAKLLFSPDMGLLCIWFQADCWWSITYELPAQFVWDVLAVYAEDGKTPCCSRLIIICCHTHTRTCTQAVFMPTPGLWPLVYFPYYYELACMVLLHPHNWMLFFIGRKTFICLFFFCKLRISAAVIPSSVFSTHPDCKSCICKLYCQN